MNYGIWRHENALGNSAEQVVNLSNYIKKIGDLKPVIFVEKEFQMHMAMCIPNATIYFYDLPGSDLDKLNEIQKTDKVNKYLQNIHMPDVYFSDKSLTYPSVWSDLKNQDNSLILPDGYIPVMDVNEKTICMQIREPKTYWKRVDGDNNEVERFVDKDIYFQVALHFADKGFKVIRIGDSKQTPMPSHENIIDFALNPSRTMLDDLYISSKSKCFLSCDSGIWPAAYALGANLIISNVTSTMRKGVLYKPEIMDWMSSATIIPKKWQNSWFGGYYIDNTKEQLIKAIDSYL